MLISMFPQDIRRCECAELRFGVSASFRVHHSNLTGSCFCSFFLETLRMFPPVRIPFFIPSYISSHQALPGPTYPQDVSRGHDAECSKCRWREDHGSRAQRRQCHHPHSRPALQPFVHSLLLALDSFLMSSQLGIGRIRMSSGRAGSWSRTGRETPSVRSAPVSWLDVLPCHLSAHSHCLPLFRGAFMHRTSVR